MLLSDVMSTVFMCAFGFSHLIFQQTTTTETAEKLGFLSLVALSGFVRGRKINHVSQSR